MDYSLYDDNCPYWQQPEHTAYYSNSESTYQEEQEYEQVSNYGSYEMSMGEATFNEQEMVHSHNQEEGDAEDWENGELEQGYELEAQRYEATERDSPYREPTPPWEHSYPTLDSPFADYTLWLVPQDFPT